MARNLVRIGSRVYDLPGGGGWIERIQRNPQAGICYEVKPELAPGTYTEAVRGTVKYVENHSNDFFREMEILYPEFQVISASVVSLPDSVCMYIVYCV